MEKFYSAITTTVCVIICSIGFNCHIAEPNDVGIDSEIDIVKVHADAASDSASDAISDTLPDDGASDGSSDISDAISDSNSDAASDDCITDSENNINR